MVKGAVIIDVAEFESRMVIEHMSSGAIHICVESSDVNIAVITDCYPLLAIEKRSNFFAGSTVFYLIDLFGFRQAPPRLKR